MKNDIPIVNYFPEEFTRWQDKFVQFTVDGTYFLRLGPVNQYHADIVRHFCEELGIESRTEKGGDWTDIVYPNDPKVNVVGAGDMYRIKGTYHYGGHSRAYCIKPDITHMSKIAEQFPDKKIVSEKPFNESI